LDHNDVIWGGSKGGKLWKTNREEEDETKKKIWKRIGKVRGTCGRKP
jgi:hypothetical protein